MKNAILFDLDGTLWDSGETVIAAWNDVLISLGMEKYTKTVDDMHSYMGKTLPAIAEMVMPDIPEKRRMEILNACCEEEQKRLAVTGGKLYPQLEETLQKLSESYFLGIISNCQCGYIETFLDAHNMAKYFSDTECNGGTGLTKGENIRLVIERNGIDRAVYVGDTLMDMQAADQAGVPFIHAAYGFGKPDRETESISEIGEIISVAEKILSKK